MRQVIAAIIFVVSTGAAVAQQLSAEQAMRANQGTVGVITGMEGGTYARTGADLTILDDGALRVLPILGKGSLQNLSDILYLKGVDIGFVQADALTYAKQHGMFPDLTQKHPLHRQTVRRRGSCPRPQGHRAARGPERPARQRRRHRQRFCNDRRDPARCARHQGKGRARKAGHRRAGAEARRHRRDHPCWRRTDPAVVRRVGRQRHPFPAPRAQPKPSRRPICRISSRTTPIPRSSRPTRRCRRLPSAT